MAKIGIIGIGNMGSAILKGLLHVYGKGDIIFTDVNEEKCEEITEEPKLDCAHRELEEETGFKTDKEKMEYLISVNTTVAFCDEAIDIFVARELEPSRQHLDDDECIDVEEWTVADLEKLIFEGKITDGKTIAAIMAYARKYHVE